MEELKYPIGRFKAPASISAADRARLIDEVVACPGQLRQAVKGLSDAQLDTPYRPEGWTLRQVVHHVPDSHMNCYIRFMLAATEDNPTIRVYEEQLWAELPEAKSGPIEMSQVLLDAVHVRWVARLRNMKDADFARAFVHPQLGVMPLDKALALYAWHGKHHIAHVTSLRNREGW
jgi:uncharacterized damage-inducible protein DinB